MPLEITSVYRQILSQIVAALGLGKAIPIPSNVEVTWDEGEPAGTDLTTGLVRVKWQEEGPKANLWAYAEAVVGPPSGFEVTVLALYGTMSQVNPLHTRKHVKTNFPGIGTHWTWERQNALIRFSLWLPPKNWTGDPAAIMARLRHEEEKEVRGLRRLAEAIQTPDFEDK